MIPRDASDDLASGLDVAGTVDLCTGVFGVAGEFVQVAVQIGQDPVLDRTAVAAEVLPVGYLGQGGATQLAEQLCYPAESATLVSVREGLLDVATEWLGATALGLSFLC